MGKQFECQAFPEYWNTLTKIEFLQRKIILNSVAYYVYDQSPLTDSFYDGICRQLVVLQEEYNKEGGDFVKDSRFGYAFYDFDGSTGFHLYNRLKPSDKYYIDIMGRVKFSKEYNRGKNGYKHF